MMEVAGATPLGATCPPGGHLPPCGVDARWHSIISGFSLKVDVEASDVIDHLYHPPSTEVRVRYWLRAPPV